MWYREIDNIVFLLKLYDSVPDLIDVQVNEISILGEGDKIRIVFNMPRFADNSPQKWRDSKVDVIAVELDFIEISNFNIVINDLGYRANIFIEKKRENKLEVKLEGDISCSFHAEYAMIQRIRGVSLDKE